MLSALTPQSIAGPGGEGTNVANFPIAELLLENRDRQPDNLHIGFFRIPLVWPLHQLFGDKDVLALAGEAIGDPHPGQLRHTARSQPGLFAEFASGQRLGLYVVCFPSALGQFKRSFPDGVAELLDQPNVIAVNGHNDRAILFIDDAVDAMGSVATLNAVFAQT